MRRVVSVLGALWFAFSLFGARLFNQPVIVKQPDGTSLSLLASGDEFHNWLHDKDNYTIIQNGKTGWYTYAVRSGNTVTAGSNIVGQCNPEGLGLERGINLSPEAIREKHRLFYGSYNDTRASRTPHTGIINNLVIFIRFI